MKLLSKRRTEVQVKRIVRGRISQLFNNYLANGGRLPAAIYTPFELPENKYRGMDVFVTVTAPTVMVAARHDTF